MPINIKFLIKRLLGITVKSLDFLVSKKKNYLLIASRHGEVLDGNALALFSFLNKKEEFVLRYYLRNNSKDPQAIGFRNLSDIIFFLQVKYVFVTHGIGDISPLSISSKKITVNLWHGILMRGIGLSRNEITDHEWKQAKNGIKSDFVLFPSKIAAHRFNYSQNAPFLKFLLCGQPRNDQLINQTKTKLNNIISIQTYSRVILYAPTYRDYEESKWFNVKGFDINVFNDFLRDNNILLLFRPHRTEKGSANKLVKTNIKLFDAEICKDINQVLNDIDILLTDYSSIFLDFLLLDRPMLFFQNDFEQYNSYYNFLFDDPEIWFPGYRPLDFNELKHALEVIIHGVDYFEETRKITRNLLEYYEDGKACNKIYKSIINEDLAKYKEQRKREFVL